MVWKKRLTKLICLLTILLLISITVHTAFSPSFFSTKAEKITPSISILNVQSYPKKGGYWTVSFSVEGTADLKISTDEQTTWDLSDCSSCDLLFKSVKNKTKIFEPTWINQSVIFSNFSSSTIVYECSLVQTMGRHVLKFTFGNDTVYAYNDATDWWDHQWGFRKKITINHSQVHGSLKDFPVLINISDADLRQKASSDGHDITFISYLDNETKYDHEIENYSNGNLTAWVKIPDLSSLESVDLWMYYNNSDCSNQETNPTLVWDNRYQMVHHLEETDIDGGNGDISDSTANNNNGTTHFMDSTDQVSGIVDGSFDFDGENDNISTSYASEIMTLSFWFKTNDFSLDHSLCGQRYDAVEKAGNWQMNWTSTNTLGVVGYNSSAANHTFILDTSFNQDTWYNLVMVSNESNVSFYVNGTLDSAHNFDTILGGGSNTEVFHIGGCGKDGRYEVFNGTIDEVRISTIVRNFSWIKTAYNTARNQTEFIILGSEESASPQQSNPTPSNEDHSIPNRPSYFEITVFDPNPDLLTLTWRTNYSGNWETFDVTNGSGNGVNDGTYQTTNTSWITLFDHQYWWSVNVTDGLHWTNETYTFTMHQYRPVINVFDLTNNTGSKINNQTGNLNVNNEYIFTINVSDRNGWDDIKFINITSWYDHGDETTLYNETNGGNYNFFIQYENKTGSAHYTLLWPDEEVRLKAENCSETIINATTRIINLSFIPGNQTRCAISNHSWTNSDNSIDDLYSWNLNCTITDSLLNHAYYKNEFGVNWYSIISAPTSVEITGAPGMIEQSNDFPITFTCNSDYELIIYLKDNLTQVVGNDIINIKDNLSLLKDADETDEIDINTSFPGSGEDNAITLLNESSPSDGIYRVVNVRFELSIPFGTWGTYSSVIEKKILRR